MSKEQTVQQLVDWQATVLSVAVGVEFGRKNLPHDAALVRRVQKEMSDCADGVFGNRPLGTCITDSDWRLVIVATLRRALEIVEDEG